MNKNELVAAIAEQADIPKTKAAAALDAFTDGVQAALAKGDTVPLVGFGTFSIKERAERTGRNPQTGAEMTIKASRIPSFKPGSKLKGAVNS